MERCAEACLICVRSNIPAAYYLPVQTSLDDTPLTNTAVELRRATTTSVRSDCFQVMANFGLELPKDVPPPMIGESFGSECLEGCGDDLPASPPWRFASGGRL